MEGLAIYLLLQQIAREIARLVSRLHLQFPALLVEEMEIMVSETPFLLQKHGRFHVKNSVLWTCSTTVAKKIRHMHTQCR
jgi:hypothetical protein